MAWHTYAGLWWLGGCRIRTKRCCSSRRPSRLNLASTRCKVAAQAAAAALAWGVCFAVNHSRFISYWKRSGYKPLSTAIHCLQFAASRSAKVAVNCAVAWHALLLFCADLVASCRAADVAVDAAACHTKAAACHAVLCCAGPDAGC
jgi:hypothetical protein